MTERESAEKETPFACLDLECSSFFNELDLLRHIKHEHLNTWSPRHKYIRANITNVEFPEEMSLLTEVKIFTEDVHERGFMLLSEGTH